MAKNKVKLDLNVDQTAVDKQVAVSENEKAKNAKKSAPKKSKKTKDGPNLWMRIKKGFQGLISELKKVEWPPMKRTKNNPGVLANTLTVIVVVLFFLVVITAFDTGLLAAFKALVGING